MTDERTRAHPDVVVVGAGVIGLGIAWRCRQRGLTVTVVDPAPGSGASTTAAGMLAPVTELAYGELDLLRLGLDSAARYPEFADELTTVTGIDVGYRRCGTVVAAWDGADLAALRDLHALQTSLGLEAELIDGRALRTLEPGLAPGLPGGVFAGGDHQVDTRQLHQALLAAVGSEHLVVDRVVELVYSGDRCTGVRLGDGTELSGGQVVLCAGAWSGLITGAPSDVSIRPVKGQTLRLNVSGEPLLRHVVRGSVKGSKVYAVPRDNGEIVVGASSEETGFDLTARAGAVYELLRDAQSLVPALSEAQFRGCSTNLRPASADNAPVLGPSTGVDGLVVATGHYRNGILLTPVTADAITGLITSGAVPDVIAPFGPGRFDSGRFTGAPR